jgi:hypothetical protein
LDKKESVLFMKRKVDRFTEPVLLNRPEHSTGSMKYIGVILDAKLIWRERVKQD